MSAEDVYEAVNHGDLEAVRQMVKANPSLKDEPYNDLTPLFWSTYYGHVGIVRFLVGEEGIDSDQYGQTPLYCAAMKGRLEVARYPNVDRWTPLMIAARNGYLEVVRYLLEEGADATLKNKYGKTALTYAKYNAEVAALLREYLPGGLMYQRRDAVQTSVLNQEDLGPDVARFCGEFIMKLT